METAWRSPRYLRFGVAGLALLGTACSSTPAGPKADVGLRNFSRVDAALYRGAQPKAGSYERLKEIGIKTVVNLRQIQDADPRERAEVEAAGLAYRAIPLKGFGAPSHEDLEKALATISDPAAQPVFVHCRRGADRTGTIVAAYQIRIDCMSNADALREAEAHGMSRLELGMRRLIRQLPKGSSCRHD